MTPEEAQNLSSAIATSDAAIARIEEALRLVRTDVKSTPKSRRAAIQIFNYAVDVEHAAHKNMTELTKELLREHNNNVTPSSDI